MNILLVVHDFLPKRLAGTELYTYYLARALKDIGHEVDIYTREDGYFEEKLREEDTRYDGIKVKTVYFNSLNKRLRLLRKFYNDFYNPLLEKHFNEHLDNTKPDIIHIQHLKGLSASFISAARKRKIPTILTLNDYWFICSKIQLLTTSSKRCSGPLYGLKCPRCLIPTLNPFIVWGLYPLHSVLFFFRTVYLKRLLNKVDLIIAPSNFLRRKFIEYGISEEKIIFSDYGMNTNLLKPYKGNPNNKLRFTFIGSVMPHKGVHVLIQAFNKLTDSSTELRVYGESSYEPNYYERLRAMATNPGIEFMGSFDNDRVYEILAETDVLVVPSIWYENSPLAIHEAALAGVPVITSNIGGMAELIERMKNGLLFKVEDANDLYEKMKLLIDNPRLIKELKGRAEEVKTIEENAKELEGIYLQFVRNKK
ncbi:MAG: glycosyltransferase family 4 protein [Thermodesulfobacteriota bacterium]